MRPVIAIVGRPNVGKSTLFNRLTRSRDAIVANVPGLTRDRQYGDGQLGQQHFIAIDTGGITGYEDGIDHEMASQSLRGYRRSRYLPVSCRCQGRAHTRRQQNCRLSAQKQ